MTTSTEPASIHTALDTYAEHIEKGFVSVASAHQRLAIVRRLKEHHDDLPLACLNLDACVAMIDLWRSRPIGERTHLPIAASTARTILSELIRFFGWLDSSPQFTWTAPSHFGQVSRKIPRLPSDQRKLREVFSAEHFPVLYRHATPVQRLMLCLAMNCGMGAAEMGRLKRNDFVLDGNGECAIDLLPGEGILRFVRPKTDVYCEWLLWPETVEAVKWAIVRASETNSDLLFVTDDGNSMWKDQSANPSSRFTHLWQSLLRSVEGYGIPRLPLTTVRKGMAEQIRSEHGDDIARVFLGHAQQSDMFNVSPQFRRLHEVLRRIRSSFAMVFEKPNS
ncbi:MAG: hypothetical protein O3A29_20575 [Planctomycetota bacterium]|nr:hypothetical protein [Planctomycetota bacterium]